MDESLSSLLVELKKTHDKEIRRIELQYLDEKRRIESGRIHAEEKLETLEIRFFELDEHYREETAKLNTDLNKARQDAHDTLNSLAEINQKLLHAENMRDNFYREKHNLLERLQAQETDHIEENKFWTEEKQTFAQQIKQFEKELADSRQTLELTRIELRERNTALDVLRDSWAKEKQAFSQQIEWFEKDLTDSRKNLELTHKELKERNTALDVLRDSLEEERSLSLEQLQTFNSLRGNLEREKQKLSEQLFVQETRTAELVRQKEEEKRVSSEKINRLEENLDITKKNKHNLERIQLELTGRVSALETLRDTLNRETQDLLARLQAQEARNTAENTQRTEENKALAEQVDRLNEERSLYRNAMIAAEHRLGANFPYQAWRTILAGASNWKKVLRLPSLLWSAWRTSKSYTHSNANIWLNQIDNIFTKHGREYAENFVRTHATFRSDLASGLTKLARLLLQNDQAVALSLAKEAVAIDPRPFRRKWLAFMFFDAGHVIAAQDLLTSLSDDVKFKSSEKNKAEYIAGCRRLLLAPLPLPELKARPADAPTTNRILYVAASSLPWHVSGYTLRTHALLQILNKTGFEVLCVTRPGYPLDRPDSLSVKDRSDLKVIDGVTYETLPGPHRRKLGLDQYLLKSAEILTEKARSEHVSAIHAASNYEAALPALIAARQLGIPFIYEVRGLWEFTAASKKSGWEQSEHFALERNLESMTAQHADRVLTLTQALADELCSRGVDRVKIQLAPNAVDAETLVPVQRDATLAASLGINKGDFVIGYIGSVVAYEGLDDLVEALAMLKQRLSQAKVLIVGDGDALPGVRRLVEARGLTGQVIFAGKVAPDQVRDYYALLNLIALPRKPETVCQLVSPLKPLEAMALGIPLVVSDVAALREMVVDGKTGLVHLAGNAKSLADCIEILAKEPELQRQLAENGRQDVIANRSWKQIASNISRVYSELTNANVTPPGELDTLPESTVDLTPIPVEVGKNSLDDQGKALLTKKITFALAQGIDALHEFLSAQCFNQSRKFSHFCNLCAAQLCLDAGEETEAIKLAEGVLQEDNSASTLRSAAKIFYNAAQLERAENLAGQLDSVLKEVKPADRKFIDEIRGRAQLAAWASLPAQKRTLPVQPKRVLNILAFSLPYTSVGYATRSHGLATGIKNAGWDIRPYTRPGFPYDFKPELEGQTLPDQDDIDGIVYRRIFDFDRKSMGEVEYMRTAIAHYEKIIQQEQPELIHAASNYVTAFPALIAARRLGVPFIYEIRGFWEVTRSSRDEQFKNTAKYRFMQLFEGLTARHADRVITITTAMKEQLMERGVPEDRIGIAYNSVDPDRFMPRPPDRELASALGIPAGVPVIGYVGSFVDYEGLDDLVTACAGLKAAGRSFRLLLVGDGAVFTSLKEQVEGLGLQDITIMTGRVPHERVEDYYSLIDIAPFPRKPWEVCELVSPLKPYEAMALEKTVVVSSTRALQEIVTNGKNGLVFAKGNVADLQQKLDALATGSVNGSALSRQARTWICQERSWDVAGKVCCGIYDVVCQK